MSAPNPDPPRIVVRQRLSTRIWHWVNVVAFACMAMSGLMIFNAHPRLYWGRAGANFDPAWLEIGARGGSGYLRLGDWTIPTTGFLGVSTGSNGQVVNRAFPGWATIPTDYNLADARLWHLAFAWVFGVGLAIYLLISLANRHLQRDLAPTRTEIAPRHLWKDIRDHARLRFPTGEASARYNILQKLSYLTVLLLLFPLMIATGLAMSPMMNAGTGWLVDLLGGRQSARSLHFIVMWLLMGFVVVHIAMVLLAGPANELRSIVTGRYRLRPDPAPSEDTDG